MPDRLEPAASGRARCRACGSPIEKGALRFGEELPNAYGEGDAASVYWFHPRCAAHRRPEKLARRLREGEGGGAPPDRESLLADADLGVAHPRLCRLAGGERAPSGRARCRLCRELIPSGAWRLRLTDFADSGFFEPLGFIHASCGPAYFGVPAEALAERLRIASPDIGAADLAALT
jgi:hypothetical protein